MAAAQKEREKCKRYRLRVNVVRVHVYLRVNVVRSYVYLRVNVVRSYVYLRFNVVRVHVYVGLNRRIIYEVILTHLWRVTERQDRALSE